jgi:hypothetical protein
MTMDQAYSPGWFPDPSGRYELRYFGTSWTDQVSSAGVVTTSPLNHPAADAGSPPIPPGARPPAGPLASVQPDAAPPAVARRSASPVLVLIGGAVMAIGALLPWETASASIGFDTGTLASVNGTSEGAGPVVLIAGLVVALLAVLVLTSTIKRSAAGIATAVLTVVSLIFTVGNFSRISDDIDAAPSGVDANLGIGLILVVIASILVVIASIGLIRDKRRSA